MFEKLAKDTSEGDRSIVRGQGLVSFFENWGNLGSAPVYWELSCQYGTLKNNLQNGSDLLSKLLEEEWFELVRACRFIGFEVLEQF